MEELIWKYIDNTCTEEEKESVTNLLKTDAEFRKSYELIVDLEDQLLSVAKIPMRPDFKTHLVQKVAGELKGEKVSIKTNILPIKWIIGLSLVAVATIIYAVTIFKSTEPSITFIPSMDEKVISMIAWVTCGFIMLTLLDAILKKVHQIKRITIFFA
jgi:hypothetical protein